MSPTKSVYIIAEAGVNHNGSLDLALKLVDAAAEAGADAVKFQLFRTEALVRRDAPKAVYQRGSSQLGDSLFGMLKSLEIDAQILQRIFDYTKKKGITLLVTPFDLDSLLFLTDTLDLPRIKISSGDITNAPLLLRAAQTGKSIILSTGLSSLLEIEMALRILAYGYTNPGTPASFNDFSMAYLSQEGQKALEENVILFHCTTEYPAPYHEVNLRSMDTLKYAFGLPVGYSDHTQGISISIAAATLGACMIEKHFTLDRSLPGPDHKASLEPEELKQMVQSIRQVETSLGSPRKMPSPSELKNREVVRRSLVAATDIRRGESFSKDNLSLKRPGDGVSAYFYWDLLGKVAQRDYKQDELVRPWIYL